MHLFYIWFDFPNNNSHDDSVKKRFFLTMSHVPKDIMTIFICQEKIFLDFFQVFNYDDEKMMTSRKKKADKK